MPYRGEVTQPYASFKAAFRTPRWPCDIQRFTARVYTAIQRLFVCLSLSGLPLDSSDIKIDSPNRTCFFFRPRHLGR